MTVQSISALKRRHSEALAHVRTLERRLEREALSPDGARATWLKVQVDAARRELASLQEEAFTMAGKR